MVSWVKCYAQFNRWKGIDFLRLLVKACFVMRPRNNDFVSKLKKERKMVMLFVETFDVSLKTLTCFGNVCQQHFSFFGTKSLFHGFSFSLPYTFKCLNERHRNYNNWKMQLTIRLCLKQNIFTGLQYRMCDRLKKITPLCSLVASERASELIAKAHSKHAWFYLIAS